jgi:hypothetical protein
VNEAERQLNIGLIIIGNVSKNVTEKISYMDPKTKNKIFKDFPLKGGPEEIFNALAQWVEKQKRENILV